MELCAEKLTEPFLNASGNYMLGQIVFNVSAELLLFCFVSPFGKCNKTLSAKYSYEMWKCFKFQVVHIENLSSPSFLIFA